jgi:hypothetical protein
MGCGRPNIGHFTEQCSVVQNDAFLPDEPMHKPLISLALLACHATSFGQHAHTQEDSPLYEGTWSVQLEGARRARFVLRDWNGTWRESGATKTMDAVCRGKTYPVTVQHSNPDEFEFTVWRSTTSAKCPDSTFVMKPVDDRSLAGSSQLDAKVTMRRTGR